MRHVLHTSVPTVGNLIKQRLIRNFPQFELPLHDLTMLNSTNMSSVQHQITLR